MGMYIEITGAYPCAGCGTPITGWQSKELRYHGYTVEPLLQTLALVPGMDGEIHASHKECDHFTEYAVIDDVLTDPGDRRAMRDDPPPVAHTFSPNSPFARSLAEAQGRPIIVAANGVRYRVVPENPWHFYAPSGGGKGITETLAASGRTDALPLPTPAEAAAAVSAIERAAGTWVGLGVFEPSSPVQEVPAAEIVADDADDGNWRRIVRESKPPKRSTENCAETRYGREVYGNVRYNAALDEYEAALLRRVAEHEAGE